MLDARLDGLAGEDAERLRRTLARYDLVLGAAVGVVWGPLLFRFLLHVAPDAGVRATLACAVAAVALGWVGARAPRAWFRLHGWERSGRVYERWLGVRGFKRWMSKGDLMNARLRRHFPGYRVVAPSAQAAAAYAERTEAIERAHLAWLLGALPVLGVAAAEAAWGFALLWLAANMVTNVWPILLQRYNRARASSVLVRWWAFDAARGGPTGPAPPPLTDPAQPRR